MNLSKDKNITITKKNTGITFNTAQTFVDKDISLNLTVQDAVVDQFCSVDVVPSVDVEGENVFFDEVDNGVSVISVGGGTAAAVSTSTVSTSGFVSEGTQTKKSSDTQTKSIKQFVSGVSIPTPTKGVNSFFIKFDQAMYKFSIDSDGNITVE